MSIIKSIITRGLFLPNLHINSSRDSSTRISLYASSSFAAVNNQDQRVFWSNNRKDEKRQRRFVVRSVVQPGGSPPSEPPFNFINWIVGVALTVVLPFFSHKWTSLLKLKTEVETAVHAVEGIVDVVEKVTEGVEKVAEDIAEGLPESGGLRKAVDFVEHVAERANKDAHLVGDFIDKVQEAEEKVEEYVEEAIFHEQISREKQQEEEDKAHDNEPVREKYSDGTHKHY